MADSLTPLLDAALAYGRAGYRVHPCRSEDKRPLTYWKHQAAADEAAIRFMWDRFPDALIGLCTGDGLVVIDDDRGGEEPEPDLALTRTARTRSRGWHHYFRTDDYRIGNRVGLIPSVDVRGQGGYVIAPPSPGWEWVYGSGLGLTRLAPLPDWIVTIMTADKERARFGPGFTPRSPANPVQEGGRNDYIARFTGWYLRAFDEVGPGELAEAVQQHNEHVCIPPLPVNEVLATVRSIMRRHRA